jgi:hypothetical protein
MIAYGSSDDDRMAFVALHLLIRVDCRIHLIAPSRDGGREWGLHFGVGDCDGWSTVMPDRRR